jgi:uncharacterized membrane protein
MNRNEFINELKHRLRRLPHDEYQNAVNYYEEYLDEAGAQNEAAAIAALGSPAAVASKIIGEYAVVSAQPPPVTETKRSNALLITLIAIFASPIALPVALAFVGLIIAVAAVFFAFFVTGGALAVSGIAVLLVSLWAFTQGVATGLFYFGMGLFIFALGCAIISASVNLTKLTFVGIQKVMGRLLIRRSAA